MSAVRSVGTDLDRLARLAGAVGLALALAAGPAAAVEPGEKLDDPKLEQRAQELSAEIRCLVCQNQAISESNADLAKDLRVLVRERLQAGDSDQEIKDYLTDRYGDFVLLKPPMKPETYLLWYGPAGLVALGAVGVGVFFWRRRKASNTPGRRLSDEEERRLQKILEGHDTST